MKTTLFSPLLKISAWTIALGMAGVPWMASADGGAATDLSDLSLDQLLDTPLTVVTRRASTSRTSPGIVSVITEEEIASSGATDLIDLLNTVPGFHFATDNEGVVGIGVRGTWAHEGKVLLLVDGQEMNEGLYGTLQFGGHIPISTIKRIEIIRGPGSAIYGGNAELAVISILTRKGEDLQGMRFSGGWGERMGSAGSSRGQQRIGAELGKKVGEWDISASASLMQTPRSEQSYVDPDGAAASLRGNSDLNNAFFNLGASSDHLELRLLVDQYRVREQDGFGSLLVQPVDTDFNSTLLGARYRIDLAQGMSLSPEISYHRVTPWRVTDPALLSDPVAYDKTEQKITEKLSFQYEFLKDWSFQSGLELTQDEGMVNLAGGILQGGVSEITYRNLALYTQVLGPSPLGNWTLGARVDDHSQFGATFVPRFALVNVLGDFHYKLLYSKGFRAPNFENLRTNLGIEPETTGVAELEVGYRFSDSSYLTFNLFDIEIDDPIVYTSVNGQDYYRNFVHTGSRGLEAEYKYRGTAWNGSLNYSLYKAQENDVAYYEVPDRTDVVLAFPTHKLTGQAVVKLPWENLRLAPQLIFIGSRFGYDSDGSLRNFEPVWLANLYLSRQNLFLKGLDFGVGASNLLDQSYGYLQPYKGGHGPIPAASRELYIQATYQVKI